MPMLRTVKPKTARSKRILEKREPKVFENPKQCLLMKGSSPSMIATTALKNLFALKKPHAVLFTKKNEIHPFEDEQKLEFFSQKNDASLLVIANNSKKRPHNLTFVRMFNYQVLDMVELLVDPASFKALEDFKVRTSLTAMLLIAGDFDGVPDHSFLGLLA